MLRDVSAKTSRCAALQLCRKAYGKCDVAEYCTGDKAKCPPNLLKPKGEVSNEGQEDIVTSPKTRFWPCAVIF